MVYVEIIELRFDGELVAQQFAQRLDVPLAVAEREEDPADRVLGLHAKGGEEGAIRLGHAKLVIQDDQGPPHGIEDVEQKALGSGNSAGNPVCWSCSQC